jgi:hypothetical protein
MVTFLIVGQERYRLHDRDDEIPRPPAKVQHDGLELAVQAAGVMALDLTHRTRLPLPTPIMFFACLDDAGTRERATHEGC